MEKNLVNESYLGQLRTLADEQNETSFVTHLIDHLQSEYKSLLLKEELFFEQGRIFESDVPYLLHRLKNSFSNVGAEPASDILDQLHHAVEENKICDAGIEQLWRKFRSTADQTLVQLGRLKQ